jgi:plasmid maintenance system antidote protein VapI
MTKPYKPPHPGEVLKDGVFADGSISVTDAARVGRNEQSELRRMK